MRVGLGFDVHAFAKDRKLILGAVTIPYPQGLLGHSDADVLIHAIIDALLGAVGLGDIGSHFPDTSSDFKDISSLILLAKTKDLLKEKGYALGNIDMVIMAEKPRLRDYIPEMIQNISQCLEVDPGMVSIKATTTERLGFTGRGEGIAAQAVALVRAL